MELFLNFDTIYIRIYYTYKTIHKFYTFKFVIIPKTLKNIYKF